MYVIRNLETLKYFDEEILLFRDYKYATKYSGHKEAKNAAFYTKSNVEIIEVFEYEN